MGGAGEGLWGNLHVKNTTWHSLFHPWTTQEGGGTRKKTRRDVQRSHPRVGVKKWVRHGSSEVPNMSHSIIIFRDLKKWFPWNLHVRNRWWFCLSTAFLSLFNFDNHKIKRREFDLAHSWLLPSIYILNHSNFEAEGFHRHVNAQCIFKCIFSLVVTILELKF